MASSALSPLLSRLDDWLFQMVLPHWQLHGLNALSGVPVECLDANGAALPDVPRRGRVMPRQLFSFARALRLGYLDEDLAQRDALLGTLRAGLQTLQTTSFDPAQGFPSQIDAQGSGLAFEGVLYDHAFVALAGAELDALGLSDGAALAETAFGWIENHFSDAASGGYHTIAKTSGPKLANPHMHLLEASLLELSVGRAKGSDTSAAQARVQALAKLGCQHFIDGQTGLIAEKLAVDFGPSDDNWVEPGHCYEWAYLLHCAGEALGDADVLKDATDLFERSERFVEADGLVVDRADAEPATYRLWPQLERLRCLATFDRTDAIAPLLGTINTHYLSQGPKAGWIDKLDAEKNPIGERVPASMLYHLMTALPIITRPDRRL